MRIPFLIVALCAAARAAAAPAATAIPFKHDGGAPAWGGAGLGVLLVSVLAIGAVLVLRRRLRLAAPPDGAPRLLRIVESQRLGPRVMLSVVEFKGEHYLLSCGEHGVSCVAAPRQGSQA